MESTNESLIDAEVQQINEVNLRVKKQCVNNLDEMVVERPMSWEGELSDDTDNNQSDNDAEDEPMDSKEHKLDNNQSLSSSSRIESPMCTDFTYKSDHNSETVYSSNKEPFCESKSKPNKTSPESKSIKSQSTNEMVSQMPEVNNQVKSSVRNSVIGFSGGSRPTPTSSPALIVRPTSSSSSRSSYSPIASPLMNRHIINGLNGNSFNNINNSSTTPCSSPLQSKHTFQENNTISQRQSPLSLSSYQLPSMNTTQNGVVTHSPSSSPLPLRPVSTPITAVRNFFQISPNSLQSRSMTTTPDSNVQSQKQSITTNETQILGMQISSLSSPPYHHLLASRDSGCVSAHDYNPVANDSSSRLSQVSPLTPHSLPELRSMTASSASVASSASDESNTSDFASPSRRHSSDNCDDKYPPQSSSSSFATDFSQASVTSAHFLSIAGTTTGPGLSRQQLLSGPCPICGDRISGFHYGIFSCESCKGFFKRTVQNKKNYVCLRGANCQVSITTRKKCPACRFDKCLKMGMKLEAIREDRTRGGRSTYQCSYTLSPQSLAETRMPEMVTSNHESQPNFHNHESRTPSFRPKREPDVDHVLNACDKSSSEPLIPQLIHDILSVEHLWHNADKDTDNCGRNGVIQRELNICQDSTEIDLCNIADHRLYKIVKWCKSLPLFREIQMDDQIALLINSWCELLLLSCCYRSISTPNEIRLSSGKSVTLRQSKQLGLGTVIERMLNLTEHLRRLQFDQYEYCCLKVIILLTSDASGLKEADKVRSCQKQVLEALQTYTRTHYPSQTSKFGELLLRIPDLERTSQVGKESLQIKQKEGDVPSFNLLMELLRGDH